MDLIVESHSNVKHFSEFIGHLIKSDDGLALLEKFEGILISIPEDLLIKISEAEEKSHFRLTWANFKEFIPCSSRSLNSSTAAIPDLKWLKSGEYSLKANSSNFLEDNKWELLYNQLGEGVMLKILRKCQLFFPLSSTSYSPLYCEKAVRNINSVNSKTQSTKRDNKECITLDLRPILYGKNLVSPRSSKVEALSETEICNRLVDDILELNSGGKLRLEESALKYLKNKIVRKLLQKCSKNKTYSLILKNIYMKNDASVSASSKYKPDEKKMSGKTKSCSEIRSVTLRNRRTKKNFLREIPLTTVRKSLLSHLNRIIPKDMFGEQTHRIVKNLLMIVSKYGKNQCFSLDEILDNITIKKIPWIRRKFNKTDKTNLMSKLVKWLIMKLVFPLISLEYYVTEKQNSFNRVHFYKKTMFKRCIFSTIQRLKKNNILQVLKAKELLGKNDDINRSHSIFRVIPKGKSDVRYVIWDKLKNPLLEETKIFFKQLTSITATRFDSGAINKNFHEYWTNLIAKWNDGGHYPLYFVKVDVSDAYGSVILSLMEKNQRSRMNCVVEKRRAEEVMDHQPKTVRLPFGVNVTTDPRYEHITGERMAIFCESGHDQRHVPMESMGAPVVVPVPMQMHQGPVPMAVPMPMGGQHHGPMHQHMQQMPPQNMPMHHGPPPMHMMPSHHQHMMPPQQQQQQQQQQSAPQPISLNQIPLNILARIAQESMSESGNEPIHIIARTEEHMVPIEGRAMHSSVPHMRDHPVPSDMVRPPPPPFQRLPVHVMQQSGPGQPQPGHPIALAAAAAANEVDQPRPHSPADVFDGLDDLFQPVQRVSVARFFFNTPEPTFVEPSALTRGLNSILESMPDFPIKFNFKITGLPFFNVNDSDEIEDFKKAQDNPFDDKTDSMPFSLDDFLMNGFDDINEVIFENGLDCDDFDVKCLQKGRKHFDD